MDAVNSVGLDKGQRWKLFGAVFGIIAPSVELTRLLSAIDMLGYSSALQLAIVLRRSIFFVGIGFAGQYSGGLLGFGNKDTNISSHR